MPPAARIADATTHGMPLAPGPGSANVLIGFMPAWRAMTDQHACPAVSITGADGVGSVMMGSPTVLINFMMACRMGDIVIEKPGLALGPANPIVMGCPTVMIGDTGGGGASGGTTPAGAPAMQAMSAAVPGDSGTAAQSLTSASQNGSGTVSLAGNSALANAVGGSSNTSSPATQSAGDTPQKTWIEIRLVDESGTPVANEPYTIELPDGTVSSGSTNDSGLARLEEVDPGNCKISFPSLDGKSWSKQAGK